MGDIPKTSLDRKTVVMLGIAALAVGYVTGCGKAAGNNAGGSRTPDPVSRDAGAVDPASTTPYAVDELADKAAADRDAFMGKEVAAAGYITFQPAAEGNVYKLNLRFHPTIHKERQLSCLIAKNRVPADILDNWVDRYVTVKGKITNIHSQNYLDLKSVRLEPCELIR